MECQNNSRSIPLSHKEEYIDSLGEVTVSFTLVDISGYSQTKGNEQDWDKTAPISDHGFHSLFEMPFWVKNILAPFQRARGVIVSYVRCQIIFVYLDYIVVFLELTADHIKHVRCLLRLLFPLT